MKQVRDHRRARQAYQRVATIATEKRNDVKALSVKAYKSAVDSFGANVIRSGLGAAVAWLQRRGTPEAGAFLEDLASADLRGIGIVQRADDFAAAVRRASNADYMLATRDAIAVVSWFRRALQTAVAAEKERET
jgi:CRISPR-associated protein Cmr5